MPIDIAHLGVNTRAMVESTPRVGELSSAVAAVVRRHRDAQGLSDGELARRTLIPRSTLQRKLVSGAFTAPEIASLADLFGVTPSAIFAEAEVAA